MDRVVVGGGWNLVLYTHTHTHARTHALSLSLSLSDDGVTNCIVM